MRDYIRFIYSGKQNISWNQFLFSPEIKHGNEIPHDYYCGIQMSMNRSYIISIIMGKAPKTTHSEKKTEDAYIDSWLSMESNIYYQHQSIERGRFGRCGHHSENDTSLVVESANWSSTYCNRSSCSSLWCLNWRCIWEYLPLQRGIFLWRKLNVLTSHRNEFVTQQ